MASTPDRQTRATAFHEAGHAVLSVVERVPIIRVTIMPTEDRLGACEHRPWTFSMNPEFVSNARTDTRTHKHIRILFAGVIAEARLTRTRRWNRVGFAGDEVAIADLALKLGGTGPKATAICADERSKTESSVEFHWSAIGAVAHALLESTTLSGGRVRAIVAGVSSGEGWGRRFG